MLHEHSELVELPVVTLDALESKMHVPLVRSGSVSRTPLVNRLRASGSGKVVTVLGPAGYGKTTALAQWAARDRRPFVWVSVDEDDNDPVVLSSDVALALTRGLPAHWLGLESRGPPRRSAPHSLRRLAAALRSTQQPFVLVLDDVHLLRSRKCAAVLTALAEDITASPSALVLAGRGLPRLPVARMRAAGRLFEVGVADLALSRREVGLAARGVGLELGAAEVAELAHRTEGWPAGTLLGALALKDGQATPGNLSGVGGDDRFVADYFEFEFLSHLSPTDVHFLTRTAVLERMCGPLCDAVLESTGSAGKLESLARENGFVVSLDRRRGWYRYHREFRDFLRAELEHREPARVRELNDRAAAWCEANGTPEAAISHARAAGDSDRLARLVGRLALPMCSAGRVATVEAWLDWFDEELRIEHHPTVAVLGSWVHLLQGRPAAATRWLRAAEHGGVEETPPDGSGSVEPWISVVRAAMCRDGVERMRSDAEIAVRNLGASSGWRPTALLMLGVAQLLLGDDRADETLADAAEAAESAGATDTRILALVERSLLAAARGDDAEAETFVAHARTLVDEGGLGEHLMSALAFAASARHGLRRGELASARAERARADALVPKLTHALPWYSAQTTIELARVDLAMLDASGAQARLAAAAKIMGRRPRLGPLGKEADALRDEASRIAGLREDRATSLTTAELRLLPLLTTHLSFREIAERLFVSRNTVKTQAISVYRKLEASSRSEAIVRAVQLGLVDAAAESRPVEFTPTG